MSQIAASQRSYSKSFPAKWSVGGPQAANGSPFGMPPPAVASSTKIKCPPRPASQQPQPGRKYNQIFPKDWSIPLQPSTIVQAPSLKRENAFGGLNSAVNLTLRPLHPALPWNQPQGKTHERIAAIHGPPSPRTAPEQKEFKSSTNIREATSTESHGSAPPRPPNQASVASYSGETQRAPLSIAHPVPPNDTSAGAYMPMGSERRVVLASARPSEDPWSAAAPPAQPRGISTTYSEAFASAPPVPPTGLSIGQYSGPLARADLQPLPPQPAGEKRRSPSKDPAEAVRKLKRGPTFSKIQDAWGKLFNDEEGQKNSAILPPVESTVAPSQAPSASNGPPQAASTQLGVSSPVVSTCNSESSTASADVIIPWRSIR
ncbi:hypothetical protein CC78DRAFT_216334 [Lojkania enalia]|uniref:Uncharacterized protein n=1 Tax=Lojkania enalia TaxID=147567 RepID=A0A9P4N0J0_9PLEO|nr:hypothetical protein CC78DRAFT_216334 [Didymosphaeria enalia]